MYISIGGDMAVRDGSIIGIFDLDGCSMSKKTMEYLQNSRKKRRAAECNRGYSKDLSCHRRIRHGKSLFHTAVRCHIGKTYRKRETTRIIVLDIASERVY